MKRYHITVNGVAYDVTVEETAGAPAPAAAPPAPAAASAPAAPQQPAAEAPVSAKGRKVLAPMPGNILDVKVTVGQTVKSGDVLVVLEAMKMENDIVAPCDGTVESIPVKKGDTVDSNALLASIL